MKRYKLIKKYPGSPELGIIWDSNSPNCEKYPEFWEEIQELECGQLVYRIWGKDKKSLGVLGTYSIKNEFSINENKFATHFKALEGFNECGGVIKGGIYGMGSYEYEVIDKDYEILSFKQNLSNEVVKVSKTDLALTVEEFFKNKCWNIHSVKRLSDGEVFTIGDRVIHTNNVVEKNGIIEKFHIMSNGIWFKTNNYDVPLCFIERKAKQPLFTTEDGVDIFEDDKYFELVLTFKPHFREVIYINIAKPNIIYDYGIPEKRKKLNDNGRYYFSTKEAAEEYILMNKPCLSINDVLNNMKFNYNLSLHFNISNIKNNLKKIVKNNLSIK